MAGPIAAMFWLDDAVPSDLQLDGARLRRSDDSSPQALWL